MGSFQGPHTGSWTPPKVSFDGKEEIDLHYDQLNVKTHPDNILFAAAIAKLHYVPISTIEEQIKLFKGVKGRLEHVKTLKDIHFYNDTSSTSPESALMAIDQFLPGQLILLLGGSSKKADFTELAQKISKTGVRVILYGAEGEKIKEAIISAGGEAQILDHLDTQDFHAIIGHAYNAAKPEDSIVLSPACASFDMFKNAKARGEEFKEIVNGL